MKKRPPRCSMRIKCPPWNFVVVVAWGEKGWQSYRRAVQDSGTPDPGMEPVDENMGECSGSCVWLLDRSPSTLVHELHHCVTLAFDHLNVEDEECEAYLQTWLFKRVMAKWGKK